MLKSTAQDPYSNVPSELRKSPRWVVATKDKLPLDAKTGLAATCNDVSTWSTFEVAVQYLRKHPHLLAVGCEISEPYIGVDLDWKDEVSAIPFVTIPVWAEKLTTGLNTYSEWSPSGKGVHAWCSGKPITIKKTPIEVYSGGRYFTVTGRALPGSPRSIAPFNCEGVRAAMLEVFGEAASVAIAQPDITPSGNLPQLDKGFNIEVFLKWLGVEVRCMDQSRGVTYYRLTECPFESHSNGWRANPSITLGSTLGFECHDSDCSARTIKDVMRQAFHSGKGKCPCPLWVDASELWEKEQHLFAREFRSPFKSEFRRGL